MAQRRNQNIQELMVYCLYAEQDRRSVICVCYLRDLGSVNISFSALKPWIEAWSRIDSKSWLLFSAGL